MKKYLLRVWVMVAIGFLAMNVVGQAPTVLSFSPATEVTGVAVDSYISVEFNMHVRARTFTSNSENSFIRIHYENGDVYQEYWSNNGAFCERTLTGYEEGEEEPVPVYSFSPLSSEIISIVNDNTLRINVSGDETANYLNGLTYYVTIGSFAIYSVEYSTRFVGFSNNSTWRFTIENEPLPPSIEVYTPSQGASSTSLDQNLSIEFDTDIQFGLGNIEIYEYNTDILWHTYDVANHAGALSITGGNTLTITIPTSFDEGTQYYVLIDDGAIESTDEVAFGGFANKNDWTFTTLVSSPEVITYNPILNFDQTPVDQIFNLEFDKNIQFNPSGSFDIRLFESGNPFFISSRQIINGIGQTGLQILEESFSIDFPFSLDYSKEYYITIPANAIQSLLGGNFNGINAGEWSFTTEVEPIEITLLSPVDGAVDVPLTQSLVATFNQNIQFATGAEVFVYTYDGEVLFETLTEGAGLSITGMELSINPTADFAEGTRYYVIIPAGAIETTTGTPFLGLTLKDDWDFTTVNLPPSVAAYDPDGVTAVAVDKVLNLTFDRPVKLNDVELRTVRIRSYFGDVIFYTYVIDGVDTDDLISVSGNVLTLTPPVNFESNTEYYVEISDGAILSLSDIPFSGIANKDVWKFTTDVTAAAPVIDTGGYSPVSASTEISRNPLLELTFSENIVKGNSGYFRIFTSLDNEEMYLIPRSQFTVLDNKLTVSLTNITLAYGTQYYILIDAGLVKSSTTGVDFGGISSSSEWSFTTETAPPFWAPDYPRITDQDKDNLTFRGMTDQNGTMYFIITATANDQITAQQIRSGQNAAGGTPLVAFNGAMTANVELSEIVSTASLELGENYYLYAVAGSGDKNSTIIRIDIDRIAPRVRVAGTYPAVGNLHFQQEEEIVLVFSKQIYAINGSDIETHFGLSQGGTPVPFTFHIDAEGMVVTLTPVDPLLENTDYTITVSPVADEFGNAMTLFTRTFQTDKNNIWTGLGEETDWVDPLNWFGDTYVANKSVTIPSGVTKYPVVNSGSVNVHNLTIQPGGVLRHTGGTITATGMFTLESSMRM
jgi:hypothetical protein